MPEPEPIYMTSLSWQEAIELQLNDVNHNDLMELRRNLIGALRILDKIIYNDSGKTIPERNR